MIAGDFNGLEVLKIAIAMEEEGMQFYEQGAARTEGQLCEFLMHAAGQEKLHKETFEKIYNKLMQEKQDFDDEYLFDEQVEGYLRILARNEVFKKDAPKEDAFDDLKAAVLYAIKAEETTTELYTRMYNSAKYPEMKEMLEKMLEEEKEHIAYFKQLLEDIE